MADACAKWLLLRTHLTTANQETPPKERGNETKKFQTLLFPQNQYQRHSLIKLDKLLKENIVISNGRPNVSSWAVTKYGFAMACFTAHHGQAPLANIATDLWWKIFKGNMMETYQCLVQLQ